MNDTKLKKLSIKQLRDLVRRAELLIIEKEKTERAKLKDQLAALAAKSGYALGDLVDGRTVKRGKRGPVAVKYRDSNNPQNTWTGRGRRPRWMAGVKDIEKFRLG